MSLVGVAWPQWVWYGLVGVGWLSGCVIALWPQVVTWHELMWHVLSWCGKASVGVFMASVGVAWPVCV